MKEFAKYTREQIDSDNAQNIVLELAARAMANGNRIIIEQKERGEKYIMVDFMPTDNSNREYEYDGLHVCMISSVDGDDEGKFYSEHSNYFDAINEVCRILRENEWNEIYTESY